MIYDDGTELYTAPDGSTMAFDVNRNLVSVVNYTADAREAYKLNPYVAAPNGDTRPWYERVAEFGVTRAIDAHYGPAAVNKGSQAATYAGQNGATYTNGAPFGSGVNILLILGLGVAAIFALAD